MRKNMQVFEGSNPFIYKTADMQVIQAWYQFKVKKDVVQTHKAMKIARQKMASSRMLRNEKQYYENWLAELEKELSEGV